MSKPVNSTGFTAQPVRDLRSQSRVAEFATIAGLAISTVIALTAITVGVAHAGVADGIVDNEGGLFAIALLLGLIFIGIGGVSVLPPGGARRPRH